MGNQKRRKYRTRETLACTCGVREGKVCRCAWMEHLLHPGKTCSYEYDFGSTTELLVKGIAEHEVEMKGKAIQILARNSLPLIPTSEDAYISWRFRTLHYQCSPSSSLCSGECWTVTFSTSTVSKTSNKAVPTILSMVSSSCSSSPTGNSENLSEHWTRICMIRIAFSLPHL